MARRSLIATLVVAVSVAVPAAGAATPTSLLVPQSTAFSVLGHSCGGIREQAFATGFDPTSGYPIGDVYLQTRCGGSGRGGGYTTTTYSVWVSATWDFTGAVISVVTLSSAPVNIDPSFSAFDVFGNEVYNALTAVNVNPATCTVGNTTYCTYRAYLSLQSGFVPAPRVTSVSASSGPATGGTGVTITGTGFTGATAVSFGGTPAASFTVNADTSITAISPAASSATVDVTVTTAGGTSATSRSDRFTFVAVPTVTGVSPNSGPVDGGTGVTVTGNAFMGTTAVYFGDTPAGFTVNSDTSITAISPVAEAADTVDISVTTVGGTSAPSAADQFTFTTAGCGGPCVSIGDASMLEGDSANHNMRFVVTLSQPATTIVTVQYAVTAVTATDGSAAGSGIDFKVKTGTLTFTPNATTDLTPVAKPVSVTVFGDTVVEPDETFNVTLSNPTGGYVLGRSVGTGTILNDDGVTSGTTMGIGDSSIVRTNVGNATLTLPVTLSAPATSTITVNYSVTPDTATYSSKATGGDFGGKTSGTLTFFVGDSKKTISVPIWADPSTDTDKSFTITLSGVSGTGVTVIRSTGSGTILGR